MSGILKKLLLKFVLPVIALVILFAINFILGLAGLLVYLAYIVFIWRVPFYSYIGGIKYSTGNLDDAVKWFGRAFATGRAKPATVTSYAYLLLKSGRLAEAENILNNLISSRPGKDNEMYAKSNLALVLWKKDMLDEAIALMEEIIVDYKSSTVYGSLGYFLILKGDLEKALKFNLEAYEYNDSNTVIQDNLGQVYHLTGQLEKSAEIYEKLMAKKPTFPEAYYNYGLVLLESGQPEKAAEMMEKALNYKLSFLSTIKKEDIEKKLEEIKNSLSI